MSKRLILFLCQIQYILSVSVSGIYICRCEVETCNKLGEEKCCDNNIECSVVNFWASDIDPLKR